MAHFFITGTDTGVGKTYFTAWLVRRWREAGCKAVGLKPIAAGDRDDARALRKASGEILTLDEINPVFLREPAAPLIAAREEGRTSDFVAINTGVRRLVDRFSHVAVEGVGGWRVPLAPGYEVRDWVHDLNLPVVVVARAGLGTLNHTLLTVESIRAAGASCAGIVLNHGPEATPSTALVRRTNGQLLQDFLGLPLFEFDRLAEAAGEVPSWLG
jgi:dethiobiotin synthetase